jgi:hypothetical protein
MSTINDGGAAFPSVIQYFPDDTNYRQEQGMTLRDYFAAKALVGLISEPISEITESTCVHCTPNDDEQTRYWAPGERLAIAAYVLADAMLKARGE